MSLTLYYHPLSSFCWKALIALYECEAPFEPRLVNLGDEADRAAFLKVWPIGKFPVLVDNGRVIPESSIIIEYLAQHHPGPSVLAPADPDLARQGRLKDRFYDLHIHQHMQKVIADRIRPEGARDPLGVEQALAAIRTAYAAAEGDMASNAWAMGETFTMADCAAFPALFYADKVAPLGEDHPNLTAYLARLKARPSVARTLREAEPYMAMFPG